MDTLAKITFVLPCRERYEKFFAALDNIIDMCESDEYEIICALDENDLVLNNAFVKLKLQSSKYKNVSFFYGHSDNKIHACNREAYRATGSIIVLHSDDMVILQKGFDNIIREAAEGYSGLIHFPDGRVNEQLCTYPILTIDYLLLDGWNIYHPNFWSVYADNFQMDLAKARGCYRYIDKQIIRHEHYRGGYGVPDALMIKNDSFSMYMHDKLVYEELKKEYNV